MADSSFFQSYKGTVQPGDLFTIHRRGRSVAMVAASDDLEIVINDGSRSRFFAGASLSFDIEFEKIQIYNPNGTAETFELWTAMGRVDDNRLTASGDLNVIDPNTGDSFAEVIAKNAEILAMMQNPDSQRSPVLETGDNYFYSAAVSTTPIQVISSAANLNGVIVRRALVIGTGTCVLARGAISSFTDTSHPLFLKSISGNPADIGMPLLIPSGEALYTVGSGAGQTCFVEWDYLP